MPLEDGRSSLSPETRIIRELPQAEARTATAKRHAIAVAGLLLPANLRRSNTPRWLLLQLRTRPC